MSLSTIKNKILGTMTKNVSEKPLINTKSDTKVAPPTNNSNVNTTPQPIILIHGVSGSTKTVTTEIAYSSSSTGFTDDIHGPEYHHVDDGSMDKYFSYELGDLEEIPKSQKKPSQIGDWMAYDYGMR
ncbi:MAG: hypothetical protein Edafosvirus21_9 [Edafosvirus sp.]|uniref:Uncharacterized protein n=1 Tax=Edafosvirus sp. TaxID=2487765 RepID=A0A3G4ZUT9_9VIRU|nr:MAG: hypothetical protein Edafosvirus21_9 [Edafosvirus sp.]